VPNTTGKRLLAGALAASVLAGVGFLYTRDAHPPRPKTTGAAAVVERFQCYRCHDAPGKLVPAVREKHCVRCHQAIHAGDFDGDYSAEYIARWKKNVIHLLAVPSLTGIDRHLRRDWFVEFLQRPHDLRPNLDAEMPRLPIGPEDATAIADHFFAAQTPQPEPSEPTLGDPARGREAFVANACGRCHHFTGSGLGGPAPSPLREVRLAPDLRHARSRMTAAAVLEWLSDPKAIKPDTLMPRFDLDPAKREDLAAFVLTANLAPITSRVVPKRLPLLKRRVLHAEVQARVFKRVCWHCHSDPEPMEGDGGPGNTGGFGFPGKGLDFGSYDAILRGGKSETGQPVDLLATDATGVPRLIAVLLARHAERAGNPTRLRGMPLGLPPISFEDIQLVESWIAQGTPRE
jgi:cytochrome c5